MNSPLCLRRVRPDKTDPAVHMNPRTRIGRPALAILVCHIPACRAGRGQAKRTQTSFSHKHRSNIQHMRLPSAELFTSCPPLPPQAAHKPSQQCPTSPSPARRLGSAPGRLRSGARAQHHRPPLSLCARRRRLARLSVPSSWVGLARGSLLDRIGLPVRRRVSMVWARGGGKAALGGEGVTQRMQVRIGTLTGANAISPEASHARDRGPGERGYKG